MDTEAQDVIFRPWDSTQGPTEDSKVRVRPAVSTKHPTTPQPLLRPKLEPPEPRVVMSPLSIAMRGLVPPLPLPHLLQCRAVQELQQLQLAVASVTERKSRPKKYKCDQCDACFSNNGQLRGHLRIHSGERPYKCTYSGCGKSFTRNEELTRHKRIHTGVKPFTCHVPGCLKPFGRKDHLKKHLKTHERMASPYLSVLPPNHLHHVHHLHPALTQGWLL